MTTVPGNVLARFGVRNIRHFSDNVVHWFDWLVCYTQTHR